MQPRGRRARSFQQWPTWPLLGQRARPHEDEPSPSKDELWTSPGDGTFTSRTPSDPLPSRTPGMGSPARLGYTERGCRVQAGALSLTSPGMPLGSAGMRAGAKASGLFKSIALDHGRAMQSIDHA